MNKALLERLGVEQWERHIGSPLCSLHDNEGRQAMRSSQIHEQDNFR